MVVLPDVNVWLALSISQHRHHEVAVDWFNEPVDRTFMFCRSSQQGLLRLLTTAAVLAPYKLKALTNRQANSRMKSIFADAQIGFADEPKGLDEQWFQFADSKQASPKLWMDAYLAAFALTGGYRLVTFDKAFKQFKGLNLEVMG